VKEARKNRRIGALAKAVAASRGNRDLRRHCVTARKSLAGIIEIMERARLAVELLARARPFPGPARKKAKNRKCAGQELRVISRSVHLEQEGRAQSRTAAAPMTREEAARIVARLRRLGRALCDLSLPIQIAARFVPVADLGDFTDTVELHAHGLVNLFENLLTGNPGLLELCDEDTRRTFEIEYGTVREQMERLSKISRGEVEIDVENKLLPPEFSRGDGQNDSAESP
jgi:hypothetical protein